MVIGTIANVRAIAGQVQVAEMSDAAVTTYLEASTKYIENKTGIMEADWPANEDYQLAVIASENYAAAFAVLVVSSAKEPTARHRELLSAADRALEAIAEGATSTDDNPFFVDVNSDYQTYENNPLEIDPYESVK